MILVFLEFNCTSPNDAIKINIGYSSIKYFVKKGSLPAIVAIKTVRKVDNTQDNMYLLIFLDSIFDFIIAKSIIPAGISANITKPIFIILFVII